MPWYRERQLHASKREQLDEARTELAKAQKRRLDFELTRVRRGYLPADEVERAWKDDILRCRARLLAIPVRLAPAMAEVSDPATAYAKLQEAIYDALTELGDDKNLPDWLVKGAELEERTATRRTRRGKQAR